MGRKPRQEPIKDYLENPRTTWLFSSPTDFTDVFPQGEKKTDTLYLKPANKGTRLGKGTFRIILHLPNQHANDRANYTANINPNLKRYMEGGALEASRIRWDSGSFPSAELRLHTQKGKPVSFFLLPARHEKGAVVYATTTFPSPKTRKMVSCGVRVGFIGASKSRPDEFKLVLQKPNIQCNKGLIAAGHAPAEFAKDYKPPAGDGKEVAAAEGYDIYMTEEDQLCFYEAQGIDLNKLLEIKDVEIMDSETQNQEHERQYYNPSDAMVGDETLEGFMPTESTTIDLTSNQPTANYGAEYKRMCASCVKHAEQCGCMGHAAEGETATYSPSEEPDMVSSSDFENPTNANFSAEGEPVAVAEGTSLDGYAPIDSIEESAPIGHGVNQYFGSENALLDESTTNITVEEGVSLEGFNGVDSVVVEAPLGHGVTQWYAEGDEPEPHFDDGITGQDGPSADPTNSDFSAQGYDDRDDESIGMRHRGMHEQSLKDRRDESKGMTDSLNPHHPYSDVSTMSAETKVKFTKDKKGKMYARNRKTGQIITRNADMVGSPSPTFDEGITGQDGPSDDPTNQTFEAMRTLAPSSSDVNRARRDLKNSGYGDVIYDRYLVYRDGSSNKFYYTAITEKDGKYYPMGAYGRIGYLAKLFNIYGKKENPKASLGSMDAAYRQCRAKENAKIKKGYEDFTLQMAESFGADTAGYLQDGSLSMDGYTPLESVEVDRSSYQPTQNYGAEFEGEFKEDFKKGAGWGSGLAVGVVLPGALLSAASFLAMRLFGKSE